MIGSPVPASSTLSETPSIVTERRVISPFTRVAVAWVCADPRDVSRSCCRAGECRSQPVMPRRSDEAKKKCRAMVPSQKIESGKTSSSGNSGGKQVRKGIVGKPRERGEPVRQGDGRMRGELCCLRAVRVKALELSDFRNNRVQSARAGRLWPYDFSYLQLSLCVGRPHHCLKFSRLRRGPGVVPDRPRSRATSAVQSRIRSTCDRRRSSARLC